MVKWEQFAKRRRINIEMFAAMSYQDYCGWCNFRKVEPVSQESFEGVKRIIVPQEDKIETPVEEVVTVTTHEFDEKQLKKLKKDALVSLCQEFNVGLNNSSTKRELISGLLALNK
tara:strand:+ start:228 stop:572 length:345 start_codon:yes stop_codon:yes gene_type:complete